MKVYPNDNKLNDSKVISVRLKGKNLQLFKELNMKPTDFFNYSLKNYYENRNLNSEKVRIITDIQKLITDIHNSELELLGKKKVLEELREQYDILENKEYYANKTRVMNRLNEKYDEVVHKGYVDNIESFLREFVSFFRDLQVFYSISEDVMESILDDFYVSHVNDIRFKDIVGENVFSENVFSENAFLRE